MKIALAQLNYHIGNFTGNVEKMLNEVNDARVEHADLICFSELAICGYPPRDFLEFGDFIEQSEAAIQRLCEASDDIAIVVGGPSVNPVVEGKDLHNAAFFLYQGKVQHVAHKALLPTYDIFDEYRYFEPATSFEVVAFKGKKIALTICEDIWNIGNENPLYTICPLDELIKQKPDFILNLSASPFDYRQAEARKHVIKSNVDRYGIPLFYVNHCGAQTEIIFDGGSVVMSPNGRVFDEMPYFEECRRIYDLDAVMEGASGRVSSMDKIERMYRGLVLGVQDYFGKLGFKKAILGLSGGIDSALTAALARDALGANNVLGVLMPSPYSSGHSVNDAVQLADNLGIKHEIIRIDAAYETFLETLKGQFEGLPFNVTEENIQARCRGLILMAMSNKHGYILLNTTNKSEMAVGYGTLYGDLCGGLSVIGDVYKTEVYEMAEFINRNGEVIPQNSISKPPSAELRPNQKDSDSLPDYDILDLILFQYIEQRKGPDEIINMGFDEHIVKRALRLVNMSEFKRYQTAPVLRVSPKAFGMGRRMPIVGKYLS